MFQFLRNRLLQLLRKLQPRRYGDDELIFADSGVTITPLQLTVNGTAYDVGDIKSVKSASYEGAYTRLVIFGAMMSLFSIGMIYATDGAGAAISVIPITLGVAIAGFSLYLWAKMTYLVVVSFASGEKLKLRSKDKQRINRICFSIEKAIFEHERRPQTRVS